MMFIDKLTFPQKYSRHQPVEYPLYRADCTAVLCVLYSSSLVPGVFVEHRVCAGHAAVLVSPPPSPSPACCQLQPSPEGTPPVAEPELYI